MELFTPSCLTLDFSGNQVLNVLEDKGSQTSATPEVQGVNSWGLLSEAQRAEAQD
jgi:hypothetical protein